MKKIYTAFLFCLFGGMTNSLSAQSAAICGSSATTCQHIYDRLAYNQEHYSVNAQTRDVQYVPIVFHLIGNDDGSNRASSSQVLDMMCMLNRVYLDQDIQFYLKSPVVNLVNNTGLNNNSVMNSAAMRDLRVENAINVFVVKTVSASANISGFYQGPAGWLGNDYIVVGQNFIYAENVFPHEVGHFFSLLHPFHGWENNPWNAEEWGNPVGVNAPSDPSFFANTVPTELQDASNCQEAGDRICDTPPDYLFALNSNQNGCTEWSIPVRDPNNMVVNPQENNVMSYFPSCAGYYFTTQQKAAISNDLFNSPARDYVRENTSPNMTAINAIPNLISPQEGANINAGSSAVLSWYPVIEAQYYSVEIDTNLGFSSPNKQSKVVAATTPNALFSSLIPNTQYYWRVRPFTEYTTCTGYSDQRSFFTGSVVASTENIDVLDQWEIYPNPISQDDIHVNIETNHSFEARIQIYNTIGGLINERKHYLPLGKSTILLDNMDLSSGVYFLAIEKDGIVETKRFVKF